MTYEALQFSEVNLAGGDWRNLHIRLRIDSAAGARLHGVLLYQPGTFTYVARLDIDTDDIIPWFEPPYNTPPHIGQLQLPVDERTRENIATFIKGRLQPSTDSPKQLRFFTVPLTAENATTDDLTSYNDRETRVA